MEKKNQETTDYTEVAAHPSQVQIATKKNSIWEDKTPLEAGGCWPELGPYRPVIVEQDG